MASFRAIDWVLAEYAPGPVKVGDLLSVDAGGMPIYQVTAVSDGMISLRDERHPPVQVRSLDSFRWRGVIA
ncbi:hypothetical protein [Phenylobacterium sp.]|jgi:hypothetical protein|uniref:hypothetical protein n=1 Tax=Phenylobacterium sp. TaxID=1871053 RepID=UPI002F40249D